MTNESVHPAPETGKVAATTVMQYAQNITNFGQLYMMLKHLRSGATKEVVDAGKPIQVKLLEATGGTIYLNSNVIFQSLMDEFQKIGDSLESQNIDVSGVLESLDQQFNQLFKTAASERA